MSHILTVHKSKSDSHCGGSRLLNIIGICLHNSKNGGTLQIVCCGVPPSSYDELFFVDFLRFLERRGLPVGWLPRIFLWHIHPWWNIIGRKNMLVFLSVKILKEADFLINEHGGHIADVTPQ